MQLKQINQLPRPGQIALFATCAQINTFQAPASAKKPMLEEFYFFNTTDCANTIHFRHAGNAIVSWSLNPQPIIGKLFEKGEMGSALGWQFSKTQNMPTHTTGAWAASVPATGIQVNAANQTGNSITSSGWPVWST